MSSGRDEDALSWGGDDDPTLDVGAPAPAPALPDGFTALGPGSDEVGYIDADGTVTPAGAPAPLGNVLLVSLGVIGGIYALYVIGWIIGGLRLQGVASFLVDPAAFIPFLWLAILAPVLWFGATFVVTRHSATWVRVAWLIAGVVLLVPWPLIMRGVGG